MRLKETEQKLLSTTSECEAIKDQNLEGQERIEKLAKGIRDVSKVILEEQLTAYKITDEAQLREMLDEDAVRILEDQFMIPESTQSLIDCSAEGIFKLFDKPKLADVT